MNRPLHADRLRDLATIAPSIALSTESAAELRALAAEVLELRERLVHATNLDTRDAEIIETRAKLRREQDARADLRLELDRVRAERDEARRELVVALRTIEEGRRG